MNGYVAMGCITMSVRNALCLIINKGRLTKKTPLIVLSCITALLPGDSRYFN